MVSKNTLQIYVPFALPSKKRSLVVLYTDRRQALHNCFIGPLITFLGRHFTLYPVSVHRLLRGKEKLPKHHGGIFSVLQARTWSQLLPALERYLDGAPVVFYDQDPWEAYHDNAAAPGAYKLVHDALNVKRFLVTSSFWADYIRQEDALPAEFVRMSILPEYCDVGKEFARRQYPVAFQGSLHPHRKAFFERMKGLGVTLQTLPPVPYKQFLTAIQSIGIFLHDESNAIEMNGQKCNLNGIWVKEIEVAARGCFAIRNSDLDMDAYGISELPVIRPFTDEAEVPGIIDDILSLPEEQRNSMRREAVETIRRRNDWMTVVDALRRCFPSL